MHSDDAHRMLESVPGPGSPYASDCLSMGGRDHGESLAESHNNLMIYGVAGDTGRFHCKWERLWQWETDIPYRGSLSIEFIK